MGSLLKAIMKNIETYHDESLDVHEVVIRYASYDPRYRLTQHVVAGHGEGIPYPLEKGFWLLDLFRTKSQCILNCYVLWKAYQKGTLTNLQAIANEKKAIHIQGEISIAKLPPHPYTLLFDIGQTTPEDTREKCTYVYKNGHMFLLVHEKYFANALSLIRAKATQTVIGKIVSKEVPSFTSISNIHVMDIESVRKKQDDATYRHVPLMVGHRNKKYSCFKGENCLVDYLKWLSQQHKHVVVWAHNGGKYDFHLLLKAALVVCDSNRTTPIEILDVDGRYIQLTIHTQCNTTLVFRDSYALIPGSLNKLAKEFGIEGKLSDVDIASVTQENLLTNPLYQDYNEQDCHVLWSVLSMFQQQAIDAFEVDPLNHPSASSYGKRVFYSKYYQPSKYPLYSLPRNVHTYLYRSYGGGRCEVFTRGHMRDLLYYYDINSSYPNAGCRLLPYGIPKFHADLSRIHSTDSFLYLHPGFYRVKIKKNGTGKPLHGVMTQGKYVFPQFTDASQDLVVFSEELRYGLSRGYEYALLDGYEFKMASWGKDFFGHLYELKSEAKRMSHTAREYLYKIIVNSCYGFFGYNKYDRHVTRVYGKKMLDHVGCLEYHGKTTFSSYDDTLVSYETRDILLDDVNIAVASAITSYARMHLHSLISSVEEKGGQVLYCDTDSLITSLCMEEALPELLGSKLGQLKNECPEGIEESVFVSCKLYGYKTREDECTHAKGIKNVCFDDLVKLLSTPQSFDVWSMVTGRMKKAKGDLDVYDTTIKKELSGTYTKRQVLDNGETLAITY
jgi:hypothetical protein